MGLLLIIHSTLFLHLSDYKVDYEYTLLAFGFQIVFGFLLSIVSILGELQ